jgi:beta-lactamase regulating signal transducer with metallopeptidase domain
MTDLTVLLTPVGTALAWATLKATLLLATAALLVRIFRHQAASLRHLIWTVALGAAVALLVLPAVLPAWRVVPMPAPAPLAVHEAPPAVGKSSAASPDLNPVQISRQTVDVGVPRRIDAPPAPSRPFARADRLSWPTVAFVLWLAGLLAIVARYGWSRLALERMARRSTILGRGTAIDAQVIREMRIARPVSILMSEEIALPLTWGIVRPQIALPADAVDWTTERRRHVLQHELAHVRRLDAATQLVAQAASALFWFHPLVWFAVAQMRRERERACDDCVLATGTVASDYASDLLALVTSHGYAGRHMVALAFARRSQFEGRLLALLDPAIDRGFLSSRVVVSSVVAGLCLAAPLAAMQGVAPKPVPHAGHPRAVQAAVPLTQDRPALQSVAPSTNAAPPVKRGVDARRQVPAEPMQPRPDIFAACRTSSPGGASHSDSESSGDGGRHWMASGEFGGCRYDLKSEGNVAFSADGTRIERISNGGYFEATTNIHGDTTRFSARGSVDGTPVVQFSSSGPQFGGQKASDAWLAQFLIGIDRTTAFAVDRRLPVLLASGGPSAVLSEIEQMYTAYARYVYGERLLDAASLDPASLRRMAAIVKSIDTDHSAADLLVAIADHYPLTDPVVRSALLGRAVAMRVDHEKARSLTSIADHATLGATDLVSLLESVKQMRVDAEKGRVLVSVASSQRLGRDGRIAFTAAAETIRQPYMRDRALAALR